MPSEATPEQSQELQDITKRYHRLERTTSGTVAIIAVALFLGTYFATTLLPAVAVAAVLVVVVRTPVFRSSGTVRLRTDDDSKTVRARLADSRPPVLAFQWCVADEVTTTEHGAIYSFSYLFGLRSADMTVHTDTDTRPNGPDRVEIAITVSGTPWGTYTATIDAADTGSIVDIEYTSDRRFGLRRVPQQVIGKRYRDRVLSVQGFSVVERETHVGI